MRDKPSRLSPERRVFLARMLHASALIAAGKALLPRLPLTLFEDAQAAPPPPRLSAGGEEWDCIVLGAGAAGIAAALELTESKIRGREPRVLVLEGSDRIGGRIHTLRGVFSTPVEAGAATVHVPRRAAKELWKQIDAFDIPNVRMSRRRDFGVYHSDWKRMLEGTKTLGEFGLFKVLGMYDKLTSYSGKDKPLAEYIARRSRMEQAFLETITLGIYPGLAEETSLKGYISDMYADETLFAADYRINEGFDSIYQTMAKGLQIRFGERVKRVSYGKGGVEIGTAGGGKYRASTAICTFSIGMLQKGDVEFAPGLPDLKKRAMSALMPGYHAKFILEFDRPFWPADYHSFQRIDPAREAGRTYFIESFKREGARPTLTALYLGADAVKIRKWNDEELARRICADLDQMFPQSGLTSHRLARRPDGKLLAYRADWNSDAFALGGTSVIRYEDPEHPDYLDRTRVRAILRDPRHTPGLFWAGEAVTPGLNPGSVHGAHTTGVMAADAVVEWLRDRGSEMM